MAALRAAQPLFTAALGRQDGLACKDCKHPRVCMVAGSIHDTRESLVPIC